MLRLNVMETNWLLWFLGGGSFYDLVQDSRPLPSKRTPEGRKRLAVRKTVKAYTRPEHDPKLGVAQLQGALAELVRVTAALQELAIEKGLCTHDELASKLRAIPAVGLPPQ